ncbi:MAG: isoleucine--tRNA ligase [Planctomycetes bacterium]|nr:isoleucine--tRNA ligase [Planctomycetota bacterium]
MSASPRFVKPTHDFNLPKVEREILERWSAAGVERQALDRRDGRPTYVFFEGPPTANGRPGIHHVFARTLKDVVCRYWTMKGYHVPRKAGWDTHGLPVEIEVQKELGISIKPEIEAFGIGPFNDRCRVSVFKYKGEWEKLSKRMGYWLDYDEPYVTCDNRYVSSLWSILARFFDEGLLERGHRILPWCPKCGTGLSSHEVAQGYQDVQDPSVFVRFPRVGHPGQSFLVWTTTPWTLPANVALAVHRDLDYVRVRRAANDGAGEELLLAEALVAKVFGKETVEIVERMSGASLVGERCERPFDWLPFEGEGRHDLLVAGDFVSAEEGSGIVHMAPAFGEDDHFVGVKEGLAILNPIDAQGRFAAGIPLVGGQFVRDANSELVRELERRGKLFRRDNFTHAYPHCWRCKTPLLYWLRPSWYLRTTRIKERMVAQNREIQWFPADIGTGRFGEWLENNVDWAVSRERFWGTPLNVWSCATCRSLQVVRSEAHLRQLVPTLPDGFDLHRPHIDAIELPCTKAGCGGNARRTPEVVDCWFDSGAMPFAQHGWIAEPGKAPPQDHPADYISEGLDQTRGWFYTLHVISTFLTGKPASKRILVGNLVLDAKKQKMSKSRGNTVDPWQEIDAHGVDAVRWHLIAQSHPWLPRAYDPAAVGATGRELFGTLWNCWSFFATYAELDQFDPRSQAEPQMMARSELDRWLAAEVERLVEEVDAAFARYDLTKAANLIAAFVDRKLSNWYIRRARDRFWGRGMTADKLAAYTTLWEALDRVARVMAPLAPFFADALRGWLEPGGTSVHLDSFPSPRAERRAPELERDMEAVLDVVALGRRARSAAGINLRQPLGCVYLKGADAAIDGKLGSRFAELIAEELNVERVVVADESRLDQLRTLKVKPNFKLLGPKLGPKLGAAKQALEKLTTEQAAAVLRGEALTLYLGGAPATFTSAEVEVVLEGKPGFGVETDGRMLVAFDTTLTPTLIAAGHVREVVKRVNNSRREAGLRVADRIDLHLAGPAALLAAAEAGRARIGDDTLAVVIAFGGEPPTGDDWRSFPWEVDAEPLIVTLRRIRG